jgi:hypothetical protein
MCFFVDFNFEFQALQRYITEWLQICLLMGNPLAYIPRGYLMPLTNDCRGYPMPSGNSHREYVMFLLANCKRIFATLWQIFRSICNHLAKQLMNVPDVNQHLLENLPERIEYT